MKTKCCGECKHYCVAYHRCDLHYNGKHWEPISPRRDACDSFEAHASPTKGDILRQGSNRDLAEFAWQFFRKMDRSSAMMFDAEWMTMLLEAELNQSCNTINPQVKGE